MVNFNNCTHSGGGYLERSSVVNVVQVDQSDVEMQGDDESGGVQVKPALLRVRLDTLTSIISDIDISDEEEESGVGPLDPTALWVLRRGTEDGVREWLELLEDVKKQQSAHTGDYLAIINHALQVAVRANRPRITKLLLEQGAGIGVRDDEKRTLLHLISGCPPEEDIREMINLLIQHGCHVNAKDEDKNTPLHYAAENGHVLAVRILLDAGAKLSARNDEEDTPVHTAAENGHLQVIDELIKRDPSCIHFRGFQKETPLHDACAAGCIKVARRLIEMGAAITSVSEVGETPLHKAAETSSVAVVKLLLDEGAEVNPKTDAKRSPLGKACTFGRLEVVNLLLERGAEMKPRALEDALKEGYESVVLALVSHPQWPKAMRHTFEYEGKETTPFRHMVRTMPEVAKVILDKCTLSPTNCPDPEEPYYSVMFNYEFVEDFQNEPPDSDDERRPKGRKKFDEKQSYGCGYMEVRQAKREYFTTTWGPVGFSKENHPLWIMARHQRLGLLTHPLVGSLLHYKWNTFGQTVYLLNLFSYSLFVAFLTTLAMIMNNPQSDACVNQTGLLSVVNSTSGSNEQPCGNQASVFVIAIAVILNAVFRLLLEIPQVFVLKHRYMLEYSNWMELTLFVFSIIFAWLFKSPCLCPKDWQWQIGTIAVFLAWIDLMLFFDKFPWIGIYVLMFVQVVSTFVKALFVSCLLVIAFALTLYMCFYEPTIKRSPFSTAGRSIVKTVSMCTGELEFDSIFHQEPSGERDELHDVPFPPVSYLLWTAFIIFIPILLINMLVGLAVGDIQSIYDEAKLKKSSLQVELVLTFEELLPTKLRRRFVTGRKEVYPNKKPSIKKRLQHLFWAGEPYDTRSSINSALRPTLDANNDIQRKTNLLVRDMDDVKHGLSLLQDQNKELRQKLTRVIREVNEVKQTILEDNLIAALSSEMKKINSSLKQSESDIEELWTLVREVMDKE